MIILLGISVEELVPEMVPPGLLCPVQRQGEAGSDVAWWMGAAEWGSCSGIGLSPWCRYRQTCKAKQLPR